MKPEILKPVIIAALTAFIGWAGLQLVKVEGNRADIENVRTSVEELIKLHLR